jgi:hypothetical protein
MLQSGDMASCSDAVTSQPDVNYIGFFRLMWLPSLDTWFKDLEDK